MKDFTNPIEDVLQTSFTVNRGTFVSKVTAKDSFVGSIISYTPHYEEEYLEVRKVVKKDGKIVDESQKMIPFEYDGVTLIGSKPSQVEAYCREIHESNPATRQKLQERKFLKAGRPLSRHGT